MKVISATKIKEWLKYSDLKWYSNHVLGLKVFNEDEKQQKAFAMGTIMHLAILESEKFEKTVIVCDLAQNTNAYKDWVNENFGIWVPEFNPFPQLPEAQQEVIDGAIVPDVVPEPSKKPAKKVTKKAEEPKGTWHVKRGKNGEYYKGDDAFFVVKSSEMAMLRQVQKNASNHKTAGRLLRDGTPELSGVARDPKTGLYMNIRGDYKGDGYFLDVKSTVGCSYSELKRAFETYNYPVQHVHYLETANLIDGAGSYEHFAYLYVAKEAPHEVVLIKLGRGSLKKAKESRDRALLEIAQCEASGQWESIDGGDCLEMELSPWYGKDFKNKGAMK